MKFSEINRKFIGQGVKDGLLSKGTPFDISPLISAHELKEKGEKAMSIAEKIMEYKELLDGGAITQEEFDQKKQELLEEPLEKGVQATVTEMKETRKPLNKKLILWIVAAVGIVAVLIAGGFGIKTLVEQNQRTERAEALEEYIQPIMKEYGLTTYEVKYDEESSNYHVFAEGFGKLTIQKGLALLKKLDNVSIKDPCGGKEKITFGSATHVHPGLDVEYSYYRVSSEKSFYGFITPGIWWNNTPDGLGECIYECEN